MTGFRHIPRPTLAGLRNVVAVALMFSLTVLSWRAYTLIDSLAPESQRSAIAIRSASEDLAAVAAAQRASLEENKKSLEAGIQLAAVANGTLRSVNRLIIPRVMKNLDSADELIRSSNLAAVRVGDLVANTDHSLNASLLPEASRLVKNLGVTTESLNLAVNKLTDSGLMSLEEIRAIVSMPEWREAVKNTNAALAEVRGIVGDVNKATDELPSIAKSIERIATTSSRYQKVLLLVGILGTLAKAFIP